MNTSKTILMNFATKPIGGILAMTFLKDLLSSQLMIPGMERKGT